MEEVTDFSTKERGMKVSELKLPTELKKIGPDAVKNVLMEIALAPHGEASFFVMVQSIANTNALIQQDMREMVADTAGSREKLLNDGRKSLIYKEWQRVMDMRFSIEELAWIEAAVTMLNEGGGMKNFHDGVRAYRGAVIRNPEMKIPVGLGKSVEDHGNAIGETAMAEYEAGRLSFTGAMAAELHDERKAFPPSKQEEEKGRMWLWSHELASAVAAREASKKYFEMVGFDKKESEVLAKWIEFQVAHHGFAEFPMNLAIDSSLILKEMGKTTHLDREIPVEAVVVSGSNEVYGVVRNTAVMEALPEGLKWDVEALRAIDNVDGMLAESHPKYVNGTPKAYFDKCDSMAGLAYGSFGRTYVLNGRDGGVTDFPDMAAQKAEGFLRSAVLVCAFGADLEQDRNVFEALNQIDLTSGKRAGDLLMELTKKVQAGFAEWKKYAPGLERDYENNREVFGRLLDGAIAEFGSEWKEAGMENNTKGLREMYQFVEAAVSARILRSDKVLGLPENLYAFGKFDEGHFQAGVKSILKPAVDERIKGLVEKD